MSGIDLCSSVPLALTPRFGGQDLGVATGFVWALRGRHFLVINWHVATGRNNATGACTAPHGGVPDRIAVHFPRWDRVLPPQDVVVATVSAEGEPLWTEHPAFGREVDIAALPVDPPDPEDAYCVPMNAVRTMALKQRVGMPVFILGFPFGRRGLGFPVWKQGTFATDPYLSPAFERHMLVDSASRPGMSGSPVIQRPRGEVELEDGSHGRVKGDEGAARFVGIYSGRMHTNDANDPQLGIVWPASLVAETVEAACRRDEAASGGRGASEACRRPTST